MQASLPLEGILGVAYSNCKNCEHNKIFSGDVDAILGVLWIMSNILFINVCTHIDLYIHDQS